jgi:O-antigen ligase
MGVAAFQAATGRGYSITVGYNRVFGTFWHPNGLAFYAGQVGLYALTGLMFSPKELARTGYAAISGMALLILMLSFTRIAWVAFVISVLVLVGLRRLRLPTMILFLLILSLVLITPIQQRFDDLAGVSLQDLSSGRPVQGYTISALFDNSLHFRVYMWVSTAPLFQKRPLLGSGWGSFNNLAAGAAGIAEAAHNDYWRLLVETGIVGLVLYFGLVLSVLKAAFNLRKLRIPELRIMVNGFIASFIFYLISQITDNLFEYQTVMWYVWGMAGFIIAQASNHELKQYTRRGPEIVEPLHAEGTGGSDLGA